MSVISMMLESLHVLNSCHYRHQLFPPMSLENPAATQLTLGQACLVLFTVISPPALPVGGMRK